MYKYKLDKNIIFIGKGQMYDRIAKPLKIKEINFKEAKKIIGCSTADISKFYYKDNNNKWSALPFEIIIDDEGILIESPPVVHNGSQYLHGNVLVGKYNESKNVYEGLNSSEVSTLYNYLKRDWRNDINLNPLNYIK